MELRLTILLVFVGCFAFCKGEYYLKRYNGTIPDDAINASPISPLYVGVGAVYQKGDLIGEIFGGNTSIYVLDANSEIQSTEENLWILCTNNLRAVSWVYANYQVLDSIDGKVELGYEINTNYEVVGRTYVGREIVDGEYRIGKILGYNSESVGRPADNCLYVVDLERGREIRIASYEVMILH